MKKTKIIIVVVVSILLMVLASSVIVAAMQEKSVMDMYVDMFDKVFNSKDYNPEIVCEVYGHAITKDAVESGKMFYPDKTEDEIIKDLIISRLLLCEAERNDITVSDEELNKEIALQKELYFTIVDSKDKEFMKQICEGLGVSEEEYFELPQIRGAYERFMIKGRLLNMEIEKANLKGDEISKFSSEYEEKLYAKAKKDIVFN